ncbi:annexin A3a [Clupea harengus]|uniref:Annexin n=1 Tax=Clupea harengus TaxID=7950 RepID=A0A6P3VXS9_CLUHA|nr:annexin A3a [Clupea harengus]
MTTLWDDLESLVDAPSSFTVKGGEKSSIKPKADFNVGEDVVALRKAMEGLGTTEKTLIDILTHRSSSQREAICKSYLEATNRTLVKDLEGDTHGHFERLLVALATPPAVYDAQEVMRAIDGVGTEDSTLIEIFASRTNQQIKELSAAYLEETERKLTFDLKKEVSGKFGKAILLLAGGGRDESVTVDNNKAKEDAKALYDAGEKKWGTDEEKFVDILSKRSIPQLRQTLVEYKEISGKTLQESVEGEMSGPLEELLVAIVKCVKNVPAYLAEKLHKSMKGLGTDEATLTRILVSRSEIDMLDIRAEFKKLYEESLHSAIESDVADSYGECLKMICGGED